MNQSEVVTDHQIKVLTGEYADLISIGTDLQFVADAARKYASLEASEDQDGVARRAFWWAAVISYRRSFTTGRGHGSIPRSRLTVPPAAVSALDPAMKQVHKKALALGNQHVGHRVDESLSQLPVSLIFENRPSGEVLIAGIAQLGATYIGPISDEATQLADLADLLRSAVESEIEDRKTRLFARAAALLAGEEPKH